MQCCPDGLTTATWVPTTYQRCHYYVSNICYKFTCTHHLPHLRSHAPSTLHVQGFGETEDHTIACLRKSIAAAHDIYGFDEPELDEAMALLKQRTGRKYDPEAEGRVGNVNLDSSFEAEAFSGASAMEQQRGRSLDNVTGEGLEPVAPAPPTKPKVQLKEPDGGLSPRSPVSVAVSSPVSVTESASIDRSPLPIESSGHKSKWSWKRTSVKDQTKSLGHGSPTERAGTSI